MPTLDPENLMPSIPTASHGRSWGHVRLRWLLVPALAFLVALLLAPTSLRADDEKDGDPKKDEKKDEAAPKDETPKKEEAEPKDGAAAPAPAKPILPMIEADPKPFRAIVDAARQYFDLDEEQWKGRTALMAELEAHAAEGRYFLKDMAALRWLVYEGRSFDPPLDDRKWQKSINVTEFKKLGGTVETIKSEDWIFTYSVPSDYWKLKDFRSKYPRPAPLPLLLAMHDKADSVGQKYPGDVFFKRLYPKKDWEELYDGWILLCPTAAAGNYLSPSGMIRPLVFDSPLAELWRHYHVDFDRVILDGSDQAFVAAASKSVYFAGIVFRGDWELEDQQKDLVQNFATIPVYVVNNPKLAKQLEEAGHGSVTAGVGGKTLQKWMNERRRTPPKKFSWSVQPMRFDQVLPYWVNLDNPNWSAPRRHLQVEVVDTEKEPNTIRIDAEGINTLSLFLNDDIVDLDRSLRVTINGHIEFDGKVPLVDERMAKVGRDFDFLFNREPLRIRTSMFFGWLTPARIVSLNVRQRKVEEPPKKEATPKDEGPKANAEQEEMAERLLRSAKLLAEKGNAEGALARLEEARKLPPNKHTTEIEELYQKLKKENDEKGGK